MKIAIKKYLFMAVFIVTQTFVISMPPSAQAQQASTMTTPNAARTVYETAPVIIDGKKYFELRGAVSYPAIIRAGIVRERIESIAANESIDPNSVNILLDPLGRAIMAGDQLIVKIVDADANLEGIKVDLLAEIIKTRIIEAIKTYRMERQPAKLYENAKYAAFAFLVSSLILIIFFLSSKFLLRAIDLRYARIGESLTIQSLELVKVERVYKIIRGLFQFFRTVFVFSIIYATTTYILYLFPSTRALAKTLLDYVIIPISITFSAIAANIPNLITIAIILVLTRIALRIVGTFFEAIQIGKIRFSQFQAQWALPTYKIIRLGFIAFALVVIYPFIPGSESSAFKGLSIFAGVILSLGSSSVISNIIAGYAMIYRNAYQVGDWIQVGERFGQVVDMRLMVTHLRSTKNESIVVPNSQLMNTEIVNFSGLAKKDGLIIHTMVGIGYESNWRQVERLLLEAANRTEGLKPTPTPFILEKSLDNFCVNYELNAYCDEPQNMPRLYSNLHRNILDVFNENRVQIMTPAYEADPPTPKIASPESK